MNQTHFLNVLFQRVQHGKRKGQLRDIRFRKRPERYETNQYKVINCSHCQKPVAQVRVDSHITSGTCFVCKRLRDEVVRLTLAEQGIVTRTERRRHLRKLAGSA